MQIRRAAATAREALLDQAAAQARRRQGRTRSSRDGVVATRDGSRSLSYAELVGGRQLTMKLNPAAPLKDPKDYTIVGKPVPRLDIPAKVFGTFDFVQDVKLPGMLHARMVHPAGAEGEAAELRTTPPAARSPATCARCARATSWRWSRPTNGRPSAPRRRSSPSGRTGPGCPNRVEALRVRAQLEGRPQTRCSSPAATRPRR